jgi:hypothetical protein|tara:strand:- start:398 stop:664 length:267 start_codon:yes stop_codon:yes gene_type:complete
MAIKKEPFRTYTLEEERKWKPKQDTLTVRLNEDERFDLMEAKKLLNMASDSKALKFVFKVGLNCLIHTYGRKNLAYLFNPDRKKLSEK